jgi:hypothetical protein
MTLTADFYIGRISKIISAVRSEVLWLYINEWQIFQQLRQTVSLLRLFMLQNESKFPLG